MHCESACGNASHLTLTPTLTEVQQAQAGNTELMISIDGLQRELAADTIEAMVGVKGTNRTEAYT